MAAEINPTALITGGARRIGAAICRALHERGFDIALHYHNSAQDADALAAEFNERRADSCQVFSANLDSTASCGELIDAVSRRFRRIDVLINNASVYGETPLHSSTEEEWHQFMDTNLKAPFFLAQAARTLLAEHKGCIINILDAHTSQPTRNFSLYNLSKTGLEDLTRSMALEYAPSIRVNGVAPGAILWPEEVALDDEGQQLMLSKIPLGQLGRTEDIATAVTYLVCEADYVTGQTLKVDGGRSLVG